jgi:hypothetical protein
MSKGKIDMSKAVLLFIVIILAFNDALSQSNKTRLLSGIVVTQTNQLAPNVNIKIKTPSGEVQTTSDNEGNLKQQIPVGPIRLSIEDKNITPFELNIAENESAENLVLRIAYAVAPIQESVTIIGQAVEPTLERRDDALYKKGLFARDDQILFTLNAGINAGQHEGGGKSLEIRRFGFNLDHGGVGPGLKILVDNVQQNQATQGHGQGYLGQLKSLTPELVQDVDILNGPFNAQYGDFSGLGVVQIRQKESLPDVLTLRLQGGSFDTYRGFIAYSPVLKNANAFILYENSRVNGPFVNPLHYKRDNVTGNYTRAFNNNQALGFRFNFGRNDFTSSGQIPLDEVAAGKLDRFGFIDPDNGGRVRTGLVSAYYRREGETGDVFKLDGFVSRSLFDLYSNFTSFLTDKNFGDEIQQHDSRLQQSVNAQYLRPVKFGKVQSLLTVGANFQSSQINVGLYPSVNRNPNRKFITADNLANSDILLTSAHANIVNTAGYIQQAFDFFGGRLHIEGGLRFDYFRFNVEDRIDPTGTGKQTAGRFQPKFNLAFTPIESLPMTFYFNYGRGISSQDARGVTRNPDAPKIATTDFYQAGSSFNFKRFSVVTDFFLIDHSNQQVYIPDDGSIELAGPSRSYGMEAKTSFRLNRFLTFNGGITQVFNSFFRGTGPRIYLDSAPRTVANGEIALNELKGFTASLRYRHVSGYRLDGEDPSIRASGLDVVDVYLSKKLTRFVDLNLTIDNLFNKRYFETQNFFESRVRPADDVISRIHATPGYPFSVTVGLTFRFFGK